MHCRTVLVALMAVVMSGMARGETSADADYVAGIKAWRAHRLESLTAPDGWLTLIGLHFLTPGESTLGHAPDNKIVLAAGPDHIGAVTLDANGTVHLRVDPGVDVKVDGRQVLGADLADGTQGPATMVTSGTMSFYVINRDGKKALRVKDSASPRRVHFAGIDDYPIDPSWRIEARWVPFLHPQQVPIKNILGQVSTAMVLGKAVFTRDGRTFELLPLQDGLGQPLFFIIADATSGHTTYAAARFLYADAPANDTVVLDFNKAINPPCAFTPFATCPLPPAQNRLPIAITAGEKVYRGEHP